MVPKEVQFSLLVGKRYDAAELETSLKELNITILRMNLKTSDYITCSMDKKEFCKLFKTRLKYKTMRVGSWEITKDGTIPHDLPAKLVLLHRDLMLPYGFIKNNAIPGGGVEPSVS